VAICLLPCNNFVLFSALTLLVWFGDRKCVWPVRYLRSDSVVGSHAPCGPKAISLPLFLHFRISPPSTLFLVSFTFPLFPFLLASSIFLLFHPFPFNQNSPTPFPGRMSQQATKPGFGFVRVLILCYMYFFS